MGVVKPTSLGVPRCKRPLLPQLSTDSNFGLENNASSVEAEQEEVEHNCRPSKTDDILQLAQIADNAAVFRQKNFLPAVIHETASK